MLLPADDTTIGLTVAGALTPAGLGGCVIELMDRGLIDFLISTGANLGTAPGSPVANQITINGGTLATTATLAPNSTRGITLGASALNASGVATAT